MTNRYNIAILLCTTMFRFANATRLLPLFLFVVLVIIAVVDGFYIKIRPNLQYNHDYTYEGEIYCSENDKLLCSVKRWMFFCGTLESDLKTHRCPDRKYDVKVRKVPLDSNSGLESGEVSDFFFCCQNNMNPSK